MSVLLVPAPRPARRLVRLVRWTAVLGLVVSAALVADGWRAFGKGAKGERLARMNQSPQRQGSVFENKQPLWNDVTGSVLGFLDGSAYAAPTEPIPYEPVDPARFATRPETGLRVTWLGHSTVLVEIDGWRILTDPVWGERASPFDWLGPKRWYPPPLPLDALPQVDAVVLSHDHYDHLDEPTISALAGRNTLWFCPLGVGSHLEYWGVPEARIHELDWGETYTLTRPSGPALALHCTESRHASGRQLLDQNATLWAGWALVGAQHRVFFSGDTGLFPGMKEIGSTLGPFDLTMIEVGAYHKAWPDWHIGPEQAVEAHGWLRGKRLLPVHWGLFDLALHGWTEPIERTLAAAAKAKVAVFTPRPGESFEPDRPSAQKRWWPDVPWKTGEDDPIVSTGVDARRARP